MTHYTTGKPQSEINPDVLKRKKERKKLIAEVEKKRAQAMRNMRRGK